MLLVWLPQEDEREGQGRLRRHRPSAVSSTVTSLFEGHPLVQQHMVGAPQLGSVVALLPGCMQTVSPAPYTCIAAHLTATCMLLMPSTHGLSSSCDTLDSTLVKTEVIAQVRSLIQLYVDMEHTGRNTAFYEKFSTRHAIGQILSESLVRRAWSCLIVRLLWLPPG